MVAAPETLKRDAEQLFREQELPETFAFFRDLSPLHQRLFVVELWDALAKVAGEPAAVDLDPLVELIEDWEATAELDQAPEVAAEIERTKTYRPLGSFDLR